MKFLKMLGQANKFMMNKSKRSFIWEIENQM